MRLLTELQSHQVPAVEKLSKIKVGALYMEMGTGKTRTSLELAYIRFLKEKIDVVLWLCPCSVKSTIRKEINKHTDDSSKFVIAGIESLSSSIRLNEILLKLVIKKRVMLIVDESNLVKNHKTIRTKNIIRLSQYCNYKLILNGTPISKNEKDLFAQWYILDWRILGYKSFWSFAANHLEYDEQIRGKIKRVFNIPYLVGKIAPYTYQIKKSECLELPPKTYSVTYFSLTYEQEMHYQYVADQLLLQVDEIEPHTIYKLFTGLQNVTSGLYVTPGKQLKSEPFFSNPNDNPRIQRLKEVVSQIEGKIIIFCKYTHEIKTITNLLNQKYGEGAAIEFYGKLGQRKRQENLKKFEEDVRFLVANKTCAGYGLNLQFCNYVIFYNNDWDYATRNQAEDRVHRIGQLKNVHYIDICGEYTLDERILSCLSRKENLIESFKEELEKQKDIDTIKRFIYYKDYKGRTKLDKVEEKEIQIIEEFLIKECD